MPAHVSSHPQPPRRPRQRGASLVEFAVVGPLITLLGMALIHYGHFFFTKNHLNHAAFMAVRAGSTGHADLGVIRTAYAKALIPVYGGGTDPGELATSHAKATDDVSNYARIELLNPTQESFDDWNDEELQNSVGNVSVSPPAFFSPPRRCRTMLPFSTTRRNGHGRNNASRRRAPTAQRGGMAGDF